MNKTPKRKSIVYLVVIITWLAVWEAVSLFVHNDILMAGPGGVLITLFHKCGEADFYVSIAASLLRIGLGYLTGFIVGAFFAFAAWKNHLVDIFLAPLMAFMKAAPVASFVVLFLIWWHSSVLSFAICICVVLPQIYVSTLMGLKSTDKKLLEMAQVFELSKTDRFNYILRPALSDFLEGAIRVSAAMAIKAGVAAEVIGTPDNSIGNELYMSKIYLDTKGVLAWTLVVILISMLCEKILVYAAGKYFRHEFKCRGSRNPDLADRAIEEGKKDLSGVKESREGLKLRLTGIDKAYGEKKVLENYSAEFSKGQVYTYDWPSGAGKTTLFRIIAGLEKADKGLIEPGAYRISVSFQEDRLIEDYSAVTNCLIVCGSKRKPEAENILLKLLDEEDLYRPVSKLSGGQRRRVAVARALLKDSDIALFDEPFEGLDGAARERTALAINEYGRDKILLIASHIS